MWFRRSLASLQFASTRLLARRTKRPAARRISARRLFLEGLEVRNLLAFDLLANYDSGDYAADFAIADLNGDSVPDMIVANSNTDSIEARLGDVNGTFGPAVGSPTGDSPLALAVGNFTVDNLPDVVTANVLDVSLLVGQGDGTFQQPQTLSLPAQVDPDILDPTPLAQYVRSVAVGYLDGDQNLDLVVAASTYFMDCTDICTVSERGYVNVLLGNGNGSFAAPDVHSLGSGRVPLSVALGDVDGDPADDIITGNYNDLSVLPGGGDGTFGSPLNSGIGHSVRSISLGDVDDDGHIDTLLHDGTGNGLSVQKGDGTGKFAAQGGVDTGIPVSAAVMGDVDGDGLLDLVSVGSPFTCTVPYYYYGYYYGCNDGYYTQRASVLIGNGEGDFELPLISDLGVVPWSSSSWLAALAVADVNDDQRVDLVTIDSGTSVAIVATNDGNWEAPPSLVISDAQIVEGNSGAVNAMFTVTLEGERSGPVSVEYLTVNHTAIDGVDYVSTVGMLTFEANETSATISVAIKGDTLNEDDEQFFVNLFNGVGVVIADAQGVGTIQDNDAAPLVTISDVSKSEGDRSNTSFTFLVSLSSPSGKWVSVNFATANGTATATDSDYLPASGTAYIAPGQVTAMITITVRGDKRKEANETFLVNLSGATNGDVSDSQGVGTIVNDDGGAGGKGKPNRSSALDALVMDDVLVSALKRK